MFVNLLWFLLCLTVLYILEKFLHAAEYNVYVFGLKVDYSADIC